MNTIKNKIVALAAVLAIATSAAVAAPKATDQSNEKPVVEQVRHQLLMLPYYGIFETWLTRSKAAR